MDSKKEPGIKIDQIFLNKAHFEHAAASMELTSDAPVADHNLSVTLTAGVSDNGLQGIITISVQTTEQSTGQYVFMLEMMGLVSVEAGAENLSIAEYLQRGSAPTILPFLREAVANVTGRGRFGPLWLKPLNLTAAEGESQE
ncbi:MAG: protein-export chaperone SecB [bacterium]